MGLIFYLEIIIILLTCGILSFLDIKNQKIPLFLLIVFIGIQTLYLIFFYIKHIYLYLISAIFLFLIYFIVRLITKNKLGLGDVLFGIFQGLCLLPDSLWICLSVEVIAAIIFYTISRFFNKKPKAFAFIPFMSAGTICTILIKIITKI